jgi:hypothetical protein
MVVGIILGTYLTILKLGFGQEIGKSTFVNPGRVILFNWGTITLFWSFGRNFDANLP